MARHEEDYKGRQIVLTETNEAKSRSDGHVYTHFLRHASVEGKTVPPEKLGQDSFEEALAKIKKMIDEGEL